MANHTLRLVVTHEDEQAPNRAAFSLDGQRALRDTAAFLEALAAGHRVGSVVAGVDDGDAVAASGSFSVSGASHGAQATGSYALSNVGGTAASGTVTVSGVDGTAASNTVTLGGGAGDVTIVTDGTSVGPVAFNTDDATTATDAITALNANGTFAAKATASSGGSGVITITWDTKGTVGNSKTLTASRTAGTATVGGNGTTLGGGQDNEVTVTVDGTAVVTPTTNLSNDDAASAIAADLEGDATFAAKATATALNNVVTITWDTKGTIGNSKTLVAATSATGTATASGATLSGGEQGAVTLTINGTAVGPTDTTNLTDTAAATAVAAAVEANGTLGPLLAAVGDGADVELTWGTQGTVGNAVTLAAGVSATGTATRSGATLSGGTDTSVTATINGVGLVVNTTTTTTDAQVASLVNAAINASANALIDGVVTATLDGTDVDVVADTKGTTGNWITLAASGTGFTASGNRLTGGTNDSTTVTFSR